MTGSRQTIEILEKLNNSCTYDRTREIAMDQAELVQEFAKGEFPSPLVPKDKQSKVLVRFWWDNFDSLKETKTVRCIPVMEWHTPQNRMKHHHSFNVSVPLKVGRTENS